MTAAIAYLEIMLFFVGFVYGLLLGNRDLHWLKRSLGGGFFFALWYIAVPISLLQDRRAR
jgi:hypothetical protein